MISFRRLAKTYVTGVILFLSLLGSSVSAQNGQTLYQTNCASCHLVHKKLTGPALVGVEERWPDRKKLYAWIHNPAGYAKTDAYASNLIKEYSPTLMTAFPSLSDKDIDAIFDYIKTVPDPALAPPSDPNNPSKSADSDNSLLFGILTLILAVVALTLLQVNANLKKLADEREGHISTEPVPFWKNKSYIAMLTVILFVVGGYLTSKGAMALGRSQDYQPRNE